MNIKAAASDPKRFDGDLIAVFLAQGKDPQRYALTKGLTDLDTVFGGRLQNFLASEQYRAEAGSLLSFSGMSGIPARRVVVAGIGPVGDVSPRGFRNVVAAVARMAKRTHAGRIGFLTADDVLDVLGSRKTAELIAEGVHGGIYEFTAHKKPKKEPYQLTDVAVLVHPSRLNNTQAGVTFGLAVADAVVYTRDLVNESPSVTTPTYLGNRAKEIAKGFKECRVRVFGVTDIRSMGMGGLLAIARGSDEEPRFIRLDYNGGGKRHVALVGKGITFDAGGLSLKPPGGMETMKLDMAGAATVLGVFKALTVLKPKITVTGLIAATENMPSGKAVKPGDVVTAMNGKSIEILNTDAEGRVVLADALSYAGAEVKAQEIVDLATLTGACVVALGEEVAGLFTDDKELRKTILAASDRAGELLWPLPLTAEYEDLLKSQVADVKNIAKGRYGGAITAGLFLKQFAPEHARWAHMDIAGPAFAEKDSPYMPVGATGYAVQTMLEYLLGD